MSQHNLVQKDTKIVTQAEFDLIDAKSPAMASNNEDTGAPENGAITGQHYYNEGDEKMYFGDNSQNLKGVKECPREYKLTRSALLTLKNANNLIVGENYVVTDANVPTSLAGAEISIEATDVGQLEANSDLIQPALNDCSNWEITYDIIRNTIDRIYNHDRDVEIEGASVYTYPWASTAGNNIKVDNDSRLNFTGGNINGLIVRDSSLANIAAGDIDNVTVIEDSRLNANVGSGVIRDATISQNSTYIQNGGNHYRFSLRNDAQVTINANTHYDNEFDTSVLVNQVGTQYIRYSKFGGAVTMTIGDTYINATTFYQTPLNTTGSSGYITISNFRNSIVTATNTATFLMNGVDFSSYSSITANNAVRVYLLRTGARNYGRYLVSAGASMNAYYSDVIDGSYMQATNGTLDAQYVHIKNTSYVSNQTASLNYVNRTSVENNSNIRFLNTATNNRVYYSSVKDNSTLYASGTSNGCYFYYCTVDSGSQLRATNSNVLRAYQSKVSARSYMYSQGNTAAHYIYYSEASASGSIYFLNNAANGTRFYGVAAQGQAIVRITNATAASNIYYSTFHAYYYLYAIGGGGTKTGLHGYGRRTYTVNTTALPNGTFVQNF